MKWVGILKNAEERGKKLVITDNDGKSLGKNEIAWIRLLLKSKIKSSTIDFQFQFLALV